MSKLVCGIGFNDKKYPSVKNGVSLKEYVLWKKMIQRCYDKKFLDRRPTYTGCSVSENFKSYSYFYEWCQKQVGFKNNGWHLDKDLLIKGNRVYGENTCVFIPLELNNFIVKRESLRGDFPIGVYFKKTHNMFSSEISIDGKKVFLGYFKNSYDAFLEYKKNKEVHAKVVAERYAGSVDSRVYNSLISFVVEFSD